MSASNLDPHQIYKRVYNATDESFNVTLPANTNISLDKSEDSITVASDTSAGSVAAFNGPAAGVIIIPSISAVGYTKFSAYITGHSAGSIAIEVAADEAETEWFEAAVAAHPTEAVTFIGAAVKVRVVVKNSITGSGTVALVLGA